MDRTINFFENSSTKKMVAFLLKYFQFFTDMILKLTKELENKSHTFLIFDDGPPFMAGNRDRFSRTVSKT